MNNNKDFVMETMKKYGIVTAKALQERSESMTGTELYAEEDFIPDFKFAVAKKNMFDRDIGFVCKSTKGRVVKLVQPYDSDVYTQEPEELPAQWGFKWSTDPAKALPFIAISTSPYMKDDCCLWEGEVYRSTADNNVWSPSDMPTYWEVVINE